MKTSFSFSRVALGVIAASVLFTGCKQIAQQVQEKVGQAQTALLTEAELSGITDPLVRRHLVAQANARAYRINSKSSGRGEPVTITEVQVVGNEIKFHTTTESNGKATQEMIMIGDTTYIKDFTDNKWWKQVAKIEANETEKAPFEVPDINEIKEEFTKKQGAFEYKQLGTESCDNLTCYKYQETSSGREEGVRTFWFDNQDFLLRKEENTFGEFISTNVYSYNNIDISVPSPIKEVPTGKSIYEMMIPGATSGEGSSGSLPNIPTEEELQ